MVTFRKVICLIISFLLMNFSMGRATPRLLQDRVIGRARDGDVVQAFVFRILLGESGFGYLNFIAGFDGPLFSSETLQNETTAYFTFQFTQAMGALKFFDRGGLLILQQRGGLRVFYDRTPNGDFTRPGTFSDGILIGEYETGMIQATIAQRSGYAAITTFSDMQVFAGRFSVGGTNYIFGRMGDRVRLSGVATPDPNSPLDADAAGHLIQLGSAN